MESKKKMEQFEVANSVADALQDFFQKETESKKLSIGDVIYVLGLLCATALINCALSGKYSVRRYFVDLTTNIIRSYECLREECGEEEAKKLSQII